MQCPDCLSWPCRRPKRELDDCCACSGEVCGDSSCPAIELVVCEVCEQGDREDELLLCDGCDHACHLSCMFPPCHAIPPLWFCQRCRAAAQQKRSRVSSSKAHSSANGTAGEPGAGARKLQAGRSGNQAARGPGARRGKAGATSVVSTLPTPVDEEFMRRLDERKVKLCNCKKSRCLKQYCDCFREKEFCSARCNCTGCLNHPGKTFSKSPLATFLQADSSFSAGKCDQC